MKLPISSFFFKVCVFLPPMDLKNMLCCAAVQPHIWDFPITIYKLMKTNITLQSSYTEKKKKSQGFYMIAFFSLNGNQWGFSVLKTVTERHGSDTERILSTWKLWMQDVFLSSRGTSTACLKGFLLLWQTCSVHTYPVCHRDSWAHRWSVTLCYSAVKM